MLNSTASAIPNASAIERVVTLIGPDTAVEHDIASDYGNGHVSTGCGFIWRATECRRVRAGTIERCPSCIRTERIRGSVESRRMAS